MPTHDYHIFVHPFQELTTQKDLLRRVLDPFEWNEFIEGCIDSVISSTPEVETTEDKIFIDSLSRRLQDNTLDPTDTSGLSEADLLNQ